MFLRSDRPAHVTFTLAPATRASRPHSTTRALYASNNGPFYQVLRQSDGKTLDIGIV